MGSILDLAVIIPCYNEAGHLESSATLLLNTLDSTRYTYEVVFVDDASQDGTREIITKLCAERPYCRYIFHEINRGRGAAVKTGFAATEARVTGFIDIDLEVHPCYIPALVMLIDRGACDLATGLRHYALSQITGLPRHLVSWAYRVIRTSLLPLGVRDTETGCKFFKRETTSHIVLGSKSDNWFWDTEVMVRAAFAALKICEMPVLFLRRTDKQSTVRLLPDISDYLVRLYRLRRSVGLSLFDRSPIYWTALGYDLVMALLYGAQYRQVYDEIATLIPNRAAVVDVCAGTCRLYWEVLHRKECDYIGLDCNGHFVLAARRSHVNARLFDLRSEPVPEADYVVMCSSFYHFRRHEEEIFSKLIRAARRALIISEPVENRSTHRFRAVARMANRLTNPGVGDYTYRYTLDDFRSFAARYGASHLRYRSGQRNALAVFAKLANHEPRHSR